MLVQHDVEAERVRQQPFVVIAVEEIGRDVRIAFAVRQVDAQRALVVFPGIRIGLLGELIDFHARLLSMNAKTLSENASGCSTWGKCPARSIGANRAPGMASQ